MVIGGPSKRSHFFSLGENVKCLKCEKEMQYLAADAAEVSDNNKCIDNGGRLDANFGYGSVHDQIGQTIQEPKTHMDRLENAQIIRAYICDSCFARHAHLFEGFNVHAPRPVVTKVT